MRPKIFTFIFIFLFFPIFLFCYKITWYDKDGQEIVYPDKNDDSSYWSEAMINAMKPLVIRCLPKDWKIVRDYYNSEREIIIKISDQDVDDIQRESGEGACVCGAHSGGDGLHVMIFRTKEAYQKKSCCYCPEATALHELIHAATGIPDNYDGTAKPNYNIDACVYLALKNAGIGNCVNTLPKPTCKCIDHKGNESKCKWREEVKNED